MNRDEWEDIYFGALQMDPDYTPPVIPIDVGEGEDWGEAVTQYLLDKGVWTEVEDGFLTNFERAEEIDPNLKKFLQALTMAEQAYCLSELEAEGYIYSTVNEDGELVYGITDAGTRYVEDETAKDN